MYNDYYLQEISNKLTTTNQKLNEVIENQAQLASGDIYIERQLKSNNNTALMLVMIITLYVLMYFIVRCFK